MIAHAHPDLVVFQEATNPAVIAELARTLGFAQHAAMPGRSLAFMSRTPVDHFAWRQPRLSRHAFLEIAPAGTEMRIFGVHLAAVHSAWTERRRLFEIRALLSSIARHQQGFHVLVGDFNTLAPGERLDFSLLPTRLRAIVWLSGGRIRWRTIQHIVASGYVDVFRATHPDDRGYTFPTWNPHIRLDYAFVPAQFALRVASCEVVECEEARAASDHLPMAIELATEAGAGR